MIWRAASGVSILVLMDSSFQSLSETGKRKRLRRFNPCFNGFFFSIIDYHDMAGSEWCFNPCFNGFFFSIQQKKPQHTICCGVSILVLMDSSFQSHMPCFVWASLMFQSLF